MNESNPCDDSLAELLTLTVEVDFNGTTRYFNHLCQRHRIHGPAVITSSGHKFWYQNGKRHRTDGPALIYPSGGKSWYLNNERLTEEEFNERVQSI